MTFELVKASLRLGRGAGSVLIVRCLSVLIASTFAHVSRRNLDGCLRCTRVLSYGFHHIGDGLRRGLRSCLFGFGSSLRLGCSTSGTLLGSALLSGTSGRLLTCLLLGGCTGSFLGLALLVDLRTHRDDSGKMAGDGIGLGTLLINGVA